MVWPRIRANERVWASDRGRLTVRVLSPSVVLFIEQGYLEAGFSPLMRAANEEAVQRGVRLALGMVVKGHNTRASFEAALLQALEQPALPLAR